MKINEENIRLTELLEGLPAGDYTLKEGKFIKVTGAISGAILLVSGYNQTTFKPFIHNIKDYEGYLFEKWGFSGVFFKLYEYKNINIEW